MKKLLYLLLLPFTSHAQMTLEHSYTKSKLLQVVNLEDIGYKYVSVDTTTKNVMIYNGDHSLWKNISVSLPPNANFMGVSCVSSKLFNSDSKVEFCYSYYTLNTTASYYTLLCNESGTVLQTISDVYSTGPVKFENNWKILGYTGNSEQRIYNVPGQYVGIRATGEGNTAELNAYPNPTSGMIHLGYTLPAGATTGSMQVRSADGRMVQSYTISNQFNDILVNTGSYAAGQYFYTVQAAGMQPKTESFIVQ